MRIAGAALLVLVFGASGVKAQPVEGAPPPRPEPADQKLARHLAAWEQEAAARTNFKFDVELKRVDPNAVRGNRDYRGTIAGMKPNLLRLRLEDTANAKDYEAFIVSGEKVFAYSGLMKTVTELKRSDWLAKAVTDNVIFDLIAGANLNDIQERFAIMLFKEDNNYLYFDLKPLGKRDLQALQQIRIAIYGPKTKFAYLPAQVYAIKPNGESEQWMFRNPRQNLADMKAADFAYEDMPGFRFQKTSEPANPPSPPKLPPSPEPVVPACATGWVVPVVPCNSVCPPPRPRRSGLFRFRLRGYKGAIEGERPVICVVLGERTCDLPA